MKINIFDYGAGNLHSLAKAIDVPGVTVTIEPDPVRAVNADALVLPGVGAFSAAAERLAPGREAVREAARAGLPMLGICLGMQLLLDDSEEGPGEGLGIIPGRVTRLRSHRVPQIGWNALELGADPLFDKTPLRLAYYANSFVCRPKDERCVVAWSEHDGDRFAAAVRADNVVGVQFHPEKSSGEGVRLLHEFVRKAGER